MIVLVVYYDMYPIIMLLYLNFFFGAGVGNPSAPPPPVCNPDMCMYSNGNLQYNVFMYSMWMKTASAIDVLYTDGTVLKFSNVKLKA